MLHQDESTFQQSGTFHRSWALVGVGFHVLSPTVRKSARVVGTVKTGKEPEMAYLFCTVVQCGFVHSFSQTACSLLRRN